MNMKVITASIAAALSMSANANLSVDSGRWHTLINDNGQLYVTGDNRYGALGLDLSTSGASESVQLDLPASVVKTDATHARTIISLENGDVYLAGFQLNALPNLLNGINGAEDVAVNDQGAFVLVGGEVFFGWSTDFSSWSKIEGLSGIKQISARGKHLVAVDVNQSAFEVDASFNSTYIDGISVNKAVAGEFHSMFIDTNGQLWTSGSDDKGKLGLGEGNNTTGTPQLVSDLSGVIDVDGGNMQTVVLKDDGTVWAAGWHNYINGSVYNFTENFIQIEEISDATSVSAGYDATFVTTESDVYAWGGNIYGKLGLGDDTERHAPDVVSLPNYEPEVIVYPVIADVQPGGSYIITGYDFGSEVGTVSMDGFEFDIKSWAPDEVHIENPPEWMTGDLYLTTSSGVVSNAWHVSLDPHAPSDTDIGDAEICPAPEQLSLEQQFINLEDAGFIILDEMPEPVVVTETIEVPVEVIVTETVEVPVEVIVTETVEVEVERIVEVPVEVIKEVEVEVEVVRDLTFEELLALVSEKAANKHNRKALQKAIRGHGKHHKGHKDHKDRDDDYEKCDDKDGKNGHGYGDKNHNHEHKHHNSKHRK